MDKKFTFKLPIIIVVAVLAVVLIGISFAIGRNVTVNMAVATMTSEANLKISDEYQTKLQDLSKLNDDINEQQELLNEMNKYKQNADSLNASLEEKQQKISSLDSDIQTKEADIQNKQATIEELSSVIQRKNEEPTVIPAGNHTVSSDGGIKPGRYSVTGSRNFVVYSSGGSLKVNTILGGSYGVEEYACDLSSGDKIEASSKCTLTPIK